MSTLNLNVHSKEETYRVDKTRFSRSEAYWNRTKGLIPCGTQTLSKSPTQYVDGMAPKYLLRGKGCHVWDVDGQEYIDYGMGLHPIILGYTMDHKILSDQWVPHQASKLFIG